MIPVCVWVVGVCVAVWWVVGRVVFSPLSLLSLSLSLALSLSQRDGKQRATMMMACASMLLHLTECCLRDGGRDGRRRSADADRAAHDVPARAHTDRPRDGGGGCGGRGGEGWKHAAGAERRGE